MQRTFLLGYRPLYQWAIIKSFPWHTDYLFQELYKYKGGLKAHVTKESLDFVLNEFRNLKGEDAPGELTEGLIEQFKLFLILPTNYKLVKQTVDWSPGELERIEIRYALDHNLTVVCLNPADYQKASQYGIALEHIVDVQSIGNFIEGWMVDAQASNAGKILDIIDADFKEFLPESSESLANLEEFTSEDNSLPVIDVEFSHPNSLHEDYLDDDQKSSKPCYQETRNPQDIDRSEHTHKISSEGRTRPASNPIRSLTPYNPSSDLLQILVFLLSQYWLIQLLQEQLKNIQSAKLLSPEMAPPVSEAGLIALLELIQSYEEPRSSVSSELEKNFASNSAVLGADLSEQIQLFLNLAKSAIASDTFKPEKPQTLISQNNSGGVNVPLLNEVDRQNNHIKFNKADINSLNLKEGFLPVVNSSDSTKDVLGADQRPLFNNEEQSIDFNQSVLSLIEKPDRSNPDSKPDQPKTPDSGDTSTDSPNPQPQGSDSGLDDAPVPNDPGTIDGTPTPTPGGPGINGVGTTPSGDLEIEKPGKSGVTSELNNGSGTIDGVSNQAQGSVTDGSGTTTPAKDPETGKPGYGGSNSIPGDDPDPSKNPGENSLHLGDTASSSLDEDPKTTYSDFTTSRSALDSYPAQNPVATSLSPQNFSIVAQDSTTTGGSLFNDQKSDKPNLINFGASEQDSDHKRNGMNEEPVSGASGGDQLCGGTGDDQLCGKDTNDNLIGSGDHSSTGGCGNTSLESGHEPNQFILSSESDAAVIQGFCLKEDKVILRDVSPCQISTRIDGNNTLLLYNDRTLATLQGIQTNTVPFVFE